MTTSPPAVSVIMPCFNAASTVGLALRSLQSQRWSDWECVVVDDGSTDGSAAVVESLGDARIRLVRSAERGGRGVARQRALDACRGRFLAMLDADDFYYP